MWEGAWDAGVRPLTRLLYERAGRDVMRYDDRCAI